MSSTGLRTKNFIIITLANLLFFLSFQMVVPILPLYIDSLGGSDTVIGLTVAAGTLGGLLSRPFAGRLLDRWGRMPVYIIGLCCCTAAIFFYPFCAAPAALLVVRSLHGVSMGAATTGNTTIATDLLPAERLSEGMGYFGMVSTAAGAVAPALALYLIQSIEYGKVFFIAMGLSGLPLILSLFLRYRSPVRKGEAAPGERAALYEKAALGPALLLGFQTFSYSSIATYVALYGLGMGITDIGMYFTVFAVCTIVCRLLAGKVADRRGYAAALIPALTAGPVSYLFLAFGGSLPVFLVSAVLMGASFGITFPTFIAMAVRNVPPRRRGAANATVMSGFDLGFGAGAILWGWVSQWLGYGWMYLLNAPFLALSLFLYLWLLRTRPERYG